VTLLGLMALAVCGVPTLHGWAASAEPGEKTAAATTGGKTKAEEAAHKARSYKCTATNEITCWKADDGFRTAETSYWLACGSERDEIKFWPRGSKVPSLESIEIRPAGRPKIEIYAGSKSYARYPFRQNNFPTPFDELRNAAGLSAHAERQRGVKLIDGRPARGFVVDIKKIVPDFPVASGFKEIWIDVETNLPILIHSRMMREDFTSDRIAHYQWNVDLDPTLFDPTPPAGYRDNTEKWAACGSLPLEEQARRIAEALRLYAETCGGHYPRQITDSVPLLELSGRLGLDWPPPLEQTKKGPYAEAWAGFRAASYILCYRRDVVYNGKTVGPKDKDKVLLRWKLDDGRYAVIYGDLHSETVTAERLKTLESQP
jgi:hypothetical protein